MLLAVGINHRTAPVALRERIVFPAAAQPLALRQLAALPEVGAAAILSTCNRTELYCEAREADAATIVRWLHAYHALPVDQLTPYVYEYPDRAAVRHLLRVAAGLDSLVLGEPQILGQMKAAYRAASNAGTLSKVLGRLFQFTFSVAKQIRTDTAIGASPVSVAFAAVRLAQQIFGALHGVTALLIGAGETVELAARHLREQAVGRLVIANRSTERAVHLATQFNGYGIGLADIPAHLAEVDVIISSTASPEPILHRPVVQRALKVRKHRPMLMVDIAVPRDIDPAVAGLPDVYLYTVDDLGQIIEDSLRSRASAAREAEELVELQVEHFMGWLRSLDAVPAIRAYRADAEAVRDAVLREAQARLVRGQPADQVMQWLAQQLTNRLLHHPSTRLQQAGYEGNAQLIRAARELLGIKPGK